MPERRPLQVRGRKWAAQIQHTLGRPGAADRLYALAASLVTRRGLSREVGQRFLMAFAKGRAKAPSLNVLPREFAYDQAVRAYQVNGLVHSFVVASLCWGGGLGT